MDSARNADIKLSPALLSLIVTIGLTPCLSHTPCSNVGRGQGLLDDCLASILTQALDRNKFWFGHNYLKNCPEGVSDIMPDCYNPSANQTDSLVSRLLPPGTHGLDELDVFLKVSYLTHTGSYKACGNTYRVNESKTWDVDPLDDLQSFTPFQLLSTPNFSWAQSRTSPQKLSSDSTYYTLVILDAGYLTIHGLYVNMPGTTSHQNQTMLAYHPPINPTTNLNPYVFLLYSQPSYVEITLQWHKFLANPSLTEFWDFLKNFSLAGPKGMSWITVKVDPYSADTKTSNGLMNNCVHFVNEAFKRKQIPYLTKTRKDLSVYLDITFQSNALNVSCCCHDYVYPAASYTPNPIGDGYSPAEVVRTGSKQRYTFLKPTAFPNRSRDFQNEFHTLIMVDPDVPLPVYGSRLKPLAHLLVTNIRKGDITSGQTALTYLGPLPPDDDPHTYYFLLFRQPSEFYPRVEKYSSSDCTGIFQGRCRFDMAALIQDGDLELVGATWQLAAMSDYIRCAYVTLQVDEQELCEDVEGYNPKCSNHGSDDGIEAWLILLPTFLSVLSSVLEEF